MIYQRFYSGVIYPLYHAVLRDGANRAIKELNRNESLDESALRAETNRKLRNLIKFASHNVAYYRDQLRQIGMPATDAANYENFLKVPILTKQSINSNLQSLVADDLTNNGLDANSTSGSTGEVLRFYTDWRSGAYRKATVQRSKRWLGINPGDAEIRLWGSPVDIQRSRSLRGVLHSWIARDRLLSADTLDEASLSSYLQFCKRFKPKLLVAYPSALIELTRLCENRAENIPSLVAIICSAETLFEFDREYIESVFEVTVYNRYGCREVGDIANEVPGVNGMLVNSDRLFVEILDEHGKPCAPGDQGEVVVTDLENYGMPLIRYRIGDFARWANHDDSAGEQYPFPVLESVDGRTLDVVRSPSGLRVGGTYWTVLLRSRPGFMKFQVIQDEPALITILYVLDAGASPAFDYFRSEIAKACGAEMRVEFKETTEFEHAAGTKFRLVISRLSQH